MYHVESRHIIESLHRRVKRFIEKIETGKKKVLWKMLRLIQSDTRSTTGRNLRNLMLMETQPDTLKTSNYCQVADGEKW